MTKTSSTSLYVCDVCGYTIRHESGKTALGHIHYDKDGNYLGKDAEGHMDEIPDDGRDVEIDGREGIWIA